MWESTARGRGIWEWRSGCDQSELCPMRKGRRERERREEGTRGNSLEAQSKQKKGQETKMVGLYR